MKKHIIIVFIICMTLMCGCKENKTSCIPLIESRYMEAEDLIDYNDTTAYKLICLEQNDSIYLNSHEFFFMNDECIVIADNQIINIYSTDGKPISTISGRGNGHGEYNEIDNIFVHGNSIFVLDESNIKEYDFNGNFKDKSNVDFSTDAFVIMGDNRLFFVNHEGYSPENGEVLLTDNKNKFIKEFIPLKLYGDKRRSLNKTYFSKHDDGVYFIPIFSDKLYRINSKFKLEEVLDLNFGSKMMTFEEVTNKPIGSGTDKYTSVYEFLMTDNRVFYACFSEGIKPVQIVVNKDEKKFRLIQQNLKGTYKNYFVTFDLPRKILDNRGIDRDKCDVMMLIDSKKIKFS